MNDQPTPGPPAGDSDWKVPVGARQSPAEPPETSVAGGSPAAVPASSEPGAADSWLPAEFFGPPPPPADGSAAAGQPPATAGAGAAWAAAADRATAGDPSPSAPAPRFARPWAGRRSPRGLRSPLAAAGLAAAVIVAAVIVIGRSGGTAHPSGTPGAQAPAGPAGGPAKTVTSPPGGPGLQAPFVVDGSRFAVFAGVTQAWTRHGTGFLLAPGEHFEFVTVLARRLVPPAADLGALRYQVVDGGRIVRPVPGIGTGRRALGAPRAPAINRLVVNHLAFAVTGARASLRLEFAPTNAGGPAITVPLAG